MSHTFAKPNTPSVKEFDLMGQPINAHNEDELERFVKEVNDILDEKDFEYKMHVEKRDIDPEKKVFYYTVNLDGDDILFEFGRDAYGDWLACFYGFPDGVRDFQIRATVNHHYNRRIL